MQDKKVELEEACALVTYNRDASAIILWHREEWERGVWKLRAIL